MKIYDPSLPCGEIEGIEFEYPFGKFVSVLCVCVILNRAELYCGNLCRVRQNRAKYVDFNILIFTLKCGLGNFAPTDS